MHIHVLRLGCSPKKYKHVPFEFVKCFGGKLVSKLGSTELVSKWWISIPHGNKRQSDIPTYKNPGLENFIYQISLQDSGLVVPRISGSVIKYISRQDHGLCKIWLAPLGVSRCLEQTKRKVLHVECYLNCACLLQLTLWDTSSGNQPIGPSKRFKTNVIIPQEEKST